MLFQHPLIQLRYMIATLSICVAFASSAIASDPELLGTWQPKTYIIDNVKYPLTGVMIITPRFFIGNALFNLSDDSPRDANANAGPYTLEGKTMILNQWMQLHWRPTMPEEHFLAEGVVERIPYEVDGNTLTFLFPSGNRYISTRLENYPSSDK